MKRVLLIIALLLLTACSADTGPVGDVVDVEEIAVILEELDENKYLRAIELGGEWFLNNQNEEFIEYEYNFAAEEYSDDDNALRKAATLWSITDLARFTQDERYDELAQKGLEYFKGYFMYDAENDFYYLTNTPSKIKLGYNAFMVLSLVGIDDPKKDHYLEMFANGILYQQHEDGSLETFFYEHRDSGVDYYPGEALIGLMTLYNYNQDERYLEAVQKAFPYYSDYWRNNQNTAFVPWHSRAYYELYKITEDSEVADFVFEMNDYILDSYTPTGECSGFVFSRGIVGAVYMEGVNKAYRLATDVGDETRANCYANYIKECADAMIELQVSETDDIHALGGFKGNKASNTQRVDRNQHAVMAFIEAYELGLLE